MNSASVLFPTAEPAEVLDLPAMPSRAGMYASVPRSTAAPLSVEDAIHLWLAPLAESTQSSYRQMLKAWCAYLGATPLAAATMLHAQGYIAHRLKMPGMKPRRGGSALTSGRTAHLHWACLRSLYSALRAAAIVEVNPFMLTSPPVQESYRRKRETELVPFERIKPLLDRPSMFTSYGIQDRAWLALIFYGGLRLGELRKLEAADVTVHPDRILSVLLRETKAGADAEQVLPEVATDYILPHVERSKGALFPMAASTFRARFRAYCDELGLPAFVTPHSARATAITRLLTLGLDYREVQAFSRHSSVQMVEKYDKRRFSVENAPGRKLEY